MRSSDTVTLRLLDGDDLADMAALQRVLEEAPGYAERVTGLPVGATDAQSTYSILPPAKSYDDKFVFGIFAGSRMIGCADLIRGWPRPDTAHVGLLLLAEPYQGKGHGRRAYEALEACIRGWGTCGRVRVGVVQTNAQALPFWRRIGFAPTGEVKPYSYADVRSQVVILERQLADAAGSRPGRS